MADDPGRAWLDEHQDRAEDLIWFFYGLAVLSAVALVAPRKWPRSATPLVVAVILLSAVTLGLGGYIAYADRKSTRLNSSHSQISYAVFCLKKKRDRATKHPGRAPDSRRGMSPYR